MNRIKTNDTVVPQLDEIQKKAVCNDITTIKLISKLCYYDWIKGIFYQKKALYILISYEIRGKEKEKSQTQLGEKIEKQKSNNNLFK